MWYNVVNNTNNNYKPKGFDFMKKIILIALAIMAIGLTACGRYEDSSVVGYDVNIPINQAPQVTTNSTTNKRKLQL